METEQLTMLRANATHAEGIVQLVLSCYTEHNYSDSRLMDANILAPLLEDETLQFFVALTPAGEVVSMEGCEAIPYFPKTAQLKSHMTSLKYRGQGVGRQMCSYLFEHFDFERFYSVLGFAVTSSAVSQNIFYKQGGKMTGFLYNSYLQADSSMALTPWLPKRSHVIMVKALFPLSPPPLAVPPDLKLLAHNLYSSFGLSLEFMENLSEPTGKSVFTMQPMPEHHNVQLIIDHIGDDLPQLLEPILKQCDPDPLGTCNIFLNMVDPGAVSAYNSLCHLGFIFSGFKPLSHQSEYLVLHYSANLPVPIKDFVLHPDFCEMAASLSTFLRGKQ